MATRPRQIRILMLHGFCQSGSFFEQKTKMLTRQLREFYSGSIEFLYPTAPVNLSKRLDTRDLSSDLDANFSNDHQDYSRRSGGSELFAWFSADDKDNNSRYPELRSSLEFLLDYLRNVGPVDGVIGFSQGGAMAMMLASLAEAQHNPQRRVALATQGEPLLFDFPQAPFQFAISCSGYRSTWEFYSGFYEPKISTATLHVVADWDPVIPALGTEQLISVCHDPQVIHHQGAHCIPSQPGDLRKVAQFVREKCFGAEEALSDTKMWGRALETYFGKSEQALPSKDIIVTVTSIPSPASSVRGDSCELSETSSGQSLSRFRKQTVCQRIRVIRVLNRRRS